jgi:hypothetical protein
LIDAAFAALEAAVESQLAKVPSPTPELIRALIHQIRVVPMFAVDDEHAEDLARILETRHQVTMSLGSVLTADDYVPWLSDVQKDIDPYYWKRYEKLLGTKGFSRNVLVPLDTVTDRILGYLENPRKPGPWRRQGLVMGHVQSGKTANYVGLVAKAADAGYRLIVVIAGIHNNLRNQTQIRLDEGFVGRDSVGLLRKGGPKSIGVGLFDSTRTPFTFTTSLADFNKDTATRVGGPLRNFNEPVLIVIKKNAKTLQYLLEWLDQHNRVGQGSVDEPFLLIDDEADNASINVGGPGEVSRINGRIRELLQMFNRSSYLGYTATPFANIFIDPDDVKEMLGHDLFPRDFIVSLDPPSNYFGASRVFGPDDGERSEVVRLIEDADAWLAPGHKKSATVAPIPPSLTEAIRAFVLGRAIRLTRGHTGFDSSMLVNVSRFTDVQRRLAIEIQGSLTELQDGIRIHAGLKPEQALRDPQMNGLHETWEREFTPVASSWEDVQRHLHEAAASIKVVEVNSNSAGVLNYADYSNGLSVIAVGGMSLSRGLTLEGLTVSYFKRNSQMYDTLMQMGRWFGYRDGYDDLCRIWMLEEAQGWYQHVTEAIESLRDELRRMESVGATPEQFGLKVRAHPTTLIVTARNKFGSGKRIAWSVQLEKAFVETAILRGDGVSLQHNRTAAEQLAAELAAAGFIADRAEKVRSSRLFSHVPAAPVVNFLRGFRNHDASMHTETGPLMRYIEDRLSSELGEWDVLFTGVAGSADPGAVLDQSLGMDIYRQYRTVGDRKTVSGRVIYITNKQRVASRGVERIGLSEEQATAAETEYVASLEVPPSGPVNYPDRIYRPTRDRPLLVVHLLTLMNAQKDGEPQTRFIEEGVVAYSISFPATQLQDRGVEYIVNATWWQENQGDADDAPDDDGGVDE